MAAKKKPTTTPTEPKGEQAKPHQILLMPSAQNAIAMEAWGKFAGEIDVSELVTDLQERTDVMKGGNMGSVESMLYGQAMTLQTIFTSLARRSALNAGEYINASETYMKLALKAQAQCRATLETLSIVKNPMPYIKQANIAQGPQQVNNAYSSASGHRDAPTARTLENSASPVLSTQYALAGTHAANSETQQSKLLEDSHGGTYLDTGTTAATARSNPALETVEQVHRAEKPRG